MNSQTVVEALRIPDRLKVSTRVIGRTVFRQNAPLAPAELRALEDGLTELRVVATIRPSEFMIPAYTDDVREYLEILIMRGNLKSLAVADKIATVLHRAIPYPLIAVFDLPTGGVCLSVAHKRNPANNQGRMVVESSNSVVLSGQGTLAALETAFLASLDVSGLPTKNLFVMYQAVWNRVTAMRASAVVKVFGAPRHAGDAAELEQALTEYESLAREIDGLSSKAERETQMNRRVEHNDQISRLLPRQMAAAERMRAIMAADGVRD